MPLIAFIRGNLEPILVEFEAFARLMIPPASTMSAVALRDHAHDILLAIASDMEAWQSEADRFSKSRGLLFRTESTETAAAQHGALRQMVGFDPNQVGAEFRALRASVLKLWQAEVRPVDATTMEQMVRFNEGVDQALAESLKAYSELVAESRDMFLAVLGHDLRSPLGALLGCVEILYRQDTPEPARNKASGIAKRSVATIDQMITDLLEYTRTRLGKGIKVEARLGDVGALCRDTVDEALVANPGRRILLETEGDLQADFDLARMRQVMTNLLGNAVQHGDRRQPVLVKVRRVDRCVETSVQNWGTPIAPESLQVIFDPMVQVSKSKTEAHERPSTSLGLGLYIARVIVNAHGGSIDVSSDELEGTVFTIRLPIFHAAQAVDVQ